ncbi:MAG: alpha/beta fold hydrolase [Granulosicoccus sp.]
MPLLSVNGIQMHYEYRQTEPTDSASYPVLMLSGMASDGASWQPVVAELATSHDMLIPDNRCTGRTLPNPVETSRTLMVDDILALLDALSIKRVNVLGHSMGAMMGWALAAKAPDRVNHLISACAISHTIPARVSLFNTLAALRTTQNEAHWFELLYQFLFSPAFFEHPATASVAAAASMAYPFKQSHQSFAKQAAALETFLPAVDLSAIQCPVSLVTGANDLLMTPALLKSFCNKHNYDYTIIPHAGHALHWEQAQAFVEYISNELALSQGA